MVHFLLLSLNENPAVDATLHRCERTTARARSTAAARFADARPGLARSAAGRRPAVESPETRARDRDRLLGAAWNWRPHRMRHAVL